MKSQGAAPEVRASRGFGQLLSRTDRRAGRYDRAGDWPTKLSGGQKQRVALARALAAEPGLLLLDEPLSALDALTRIEMQSLLEQNWLAVGSTAVLVTHDIEEAVTLADRVVAVDEGKISPELAVSLERPRLRDSPPFAALAAKLLEHFMRRALTTPGG
jgi:sulfonate transport system ATP-binding protein